MNNNTITLAEAGALSAILHAARRKTTVARLAPAGRSVLIGEARYIGHLLMTGDRIAADADVRDLFLYVRLASGRDEPWLIRQLIAESPSGRFIPDFDVAAFKAAGGQASMPASVAAWEAANGVTGPVLPYGRPGGPSRRSENRPSAQPDPADLRSWTREDLLILARAAGQLWDSTGRDDPYEVLSDYQATLFNRAAAGYLIAEQGGLDATEYLRLAGDQPFESGDLVEYVSRTWAAQEATRGQRVPGIFARYTEGPGGKYVIIRGLAAPQHDYQVRRDEILRINPETVRAARSWAADCAWADLDNGDVADLSDADVVRGVQHHYAGGWAQFTRDGR